MTRDVCCSVLAPCVSCWSLIASEERKAMNTSDVKMYAIMDDVAAT